jgi:hypothetical protein
MITKALFKQLTAVFHDATILECSNDISNARGPGAAARHKVKKCDIWFHVRPPCLIRPHAIGTRFKRCLRAAIRADCIGCLHAMPVAMALIEAYSSPGVAPTYALYRVSSSNWHRPPNGGNFCRLSPPPPPLLLFWHRSPAPSRCAKPDISNSRQIQSNSRHMHTARYRGVCYKSRSQGASCSDTHTLPAAAAAPHCTGTAAAHAMPVRPLPFPH